MCSRSVSSHAFLGLATAAFTLHFVAGPVVLKAGSSELSSERGAEAARPTSNSTADIPGVSVSAIATPSGSAEKSGIDYLRLARGASAQMFSQVENVICQERVQRYKTNRSGENFAVDVVEAKVAVADGQEVYTDIVQNRHHRETMQQIGGAWSEGEYATFLQEGRRVLASPELISQAYVTNLNGTPAVMFPFEMTEANSTWDFLVKSHQYRLAFHGELWISQKTGEMLRIRRLARNLDVTTGIREVDWTVDFATVEINGHPLALPVKALYSVTYSRELSKEWNLTSFYNYKRFGSESTIHFPEAGEESTIH